MIIGLCGSIGAGKGTTAAFLNEIAGFKILAFADAVKDTCSILFGWSRHLLEGDTIESRQFRETVDLYWEAKLKIPNFTPRMALQNVGTELFRNHLNQDIWVYVLERRINKLHITDNVVIHDVRFPNEIEMIRRNGGKILRIEKGENPSYWAAATTLNQISEPLRSSYSKERDMLSGVHPSEWSWIGLDNPDQIIKNNGTLEELKRNVTQMLSRV